MPREYDDPGVFKSDARAHIRRQTGKDIVLMVGDQPTDLLKDPDSASILFGKSRAYIVPNPDNGLLLGVKVGEISWTPQAVRWIVNPTIFHHAQ